MKQDQTHPSAQVEAAGPSKRAAYCSPQLAEYGHLSALTTGGSGVAQEGALMIGGMKFP